MDDGLGDGRTHACQDNIGPDIADGLDGFN
jgi:hypothetical protein